MNPTRGKIFVTEKKICNRIKYVNTELKVTVIIDVCSGNHLRINVLENRKHFIQNNKCVVESAEIALILLISFRYPKTDIKLKMDLNFL